MRLSAALQASWGLMAYASKKAEAVWEKGKPHPRLSTWPTCLGLDLTEPLWWFLYFKDTLQCSLKISPPREHSYDLFHRVVGLKNLSCDLEVLSMFLLCERSKKNEFSNFNADYSNRNNWQWWICIFKFLKVITNSSGFLIDEIPPIEWSWRLQGK